MPEQNRANLHCRVVRIKNDPSKVDEGTRTWTKAILPVLKKQKGFVGATLTGSRRSGHSLNVIYWESDTAMKEGRERVHAAATKVLAETGGRIVEDDDCEVALLERFQPAKAGVWLRVTSVQGDPAQADKAIANFREIIVPSIKKQPGSRAAHFFVNRQTGKTFAGSVWETEQDLQRSEAPIGELRLAAVKTFGGHDPRTEAFEIYFTEILTPAASKR